MTSTTHPLLELIPLLKGQRVRLGNDRNDIDDLCKFLEHDNIDLRFSTVMYVRMIRPTGFKVCPVGLIKNKQQ
jgi:hypothetical protein